MDIASSLWQSCCISLLFRAFTMDISQLLLKSLQLMLVGMGVVFAFLLLLIVCTKLLSKFAARFASSNQVVSAATTSNLAVTNPDPQQPSPAVVAAISAAIQRYRQRH